MTEVKQPIAKGRGGVSMIRYVTRRTVVLAATAVLAVYITIVIANFGGYVDEIISSGITESLGMRMMGGWLRGLPEEEKAAILEETQFQLEEAAGLHEPFFIRSLLWLKNGLTLDWGGSRNPYAPGGRDTEEARQIIVQHLSRSLFIFGTANFLLFFVTIFLALGLSRRYGSWMDRFFILLSPLSSAPAWVYGVLMTVVLLKLFGFSIGGDFDTWPTEFRWEYVRPMLRHLSLPFLAIFISGLFQGVFLWRSYFRVYATDDSVEMARAKGLSDRMIERRYVLRPALPAVLTSFGLMLISLWQEIIALEVFFKVEGMGRLFLRALRNFDTPLVVAMVTTFTYLLMITIFVLDIVYALVDPRIRLEEGKQQTRRVAGRGWTHRLASWGRGRLSRSPAPAMGQPRLTAAEPRQQRRWRWPGLVTVVETSAAALGNVVSGAGRLAWQLLYYPTALVGMAIITLLLGLSVYAVLTIPYEDAVRLWRGDAEVWTRTPRNALPVWVNRFREDDLPETIHLDSHATMHPKATGRAWRHVSDLGDGITEITISYPVDYSYNTFPQEMALFFDAKYDEKPPHVEITWFTPDGREIRVGTPAMRSSTAYYFSQDEKLQRRMDSRFPQQALLRPPEDERISGEAAAVPGRYGLRLDALMFEEDADLDAEFVLFGQVYGLAGTDIVRRDIMIALLWGLPVALSFGILAAVATSISGMALAAVGAWFGGWLDRLVQFLTEVSLVLPFFPVALMVYILYSKSFWVLLGVTVLLSIFGASLKSYRATFLQFKEAPYVEAARAYGASDMRIVVRYLIPRIIAIIVPRIVILIPGYVFLEATLGFLGVSDPTLPTWGKLVESALSYGVYQDVYHLVLFPIGLLLLTGFAFAMVAFALERAFEPRLRDQ